MNFITSDQISERLDEVADALGPEGWEKFRRSPAGKPMMDLIHDCQAFVEHYEDAARQRANPAAALAQKLLCPLSIDEPARLRAKGAL